MNFVIIILAILGVFFFGAVLYYFLKKKAQREAIKSGIENRRPPLDYMRYTGVRCPDYWEDMGPDPNDKTKHICRNTFNIPVNSDEADFCYGEDQDSKDKRLRSFSNVDWDLQGEDMKLEGDAVNDICKWRKRCGQDRSTEASWLGVDQWMNCGYAGESSS